MLNFSHGRKTGGGGPFKGGQGESIAHDAIIETFGDTSAFQGLSGGVSTSVFGDEDRAEKESSATSSIVGEELMEVSTASTSSSIVTSFKREVKQEEIEVRNI